MTAPQSPPKPKYLDLRNAAMGASLSVALLMIVGKMIAFYLTGSTAILSDAAESVVHIAATAFAAFSLWYSARPADSEHPYGHGKIAYFSAGFEGGFIFIAAIYIIYEGIRALILGPELSRLDWGIAITGGLALVNLALGLFLIVQGKRHNTLILVANGKHVLTDMWTSLAVVFGVFLVWVTDMVWLDPAIAIAAGVNILVSGFRLIYSSFYGLLDEANRAHSEVIIDLLNEAVRDGTISDFHQLRHRQSNDAIWVEVHVLVPGEMSITEAHRHVTDVEDRIRRRLDSYQVIITTHIEPAQHAKHHPSGHPELGDPLL